MRVIHHLKPNTPEWLAYRSQHDNASEAAAMLGLSKVTTRNELLAIKHSGVAPEFDDWMQRNILDKGHTVEAKARPIAVGIIGSALYPVVVSDERLSATCDGLTLSDKVAWEHKQWNKILAAIVRGGIVPDEHLPQCMQILLVTKAESLLFMVSDGTPENMEWVEVFPDPAWFERITFGWAQFHKDLASYEPVEAAPVVIATPVMGLPALSIQVKGSITLIDNLEVFGKALTEYVQRINPKPETDQDFADLESAGKTFSRAEEALEAAENSALAQTASIDAMRQTVALYKALARKHRLIVDALVKNEKDARRTKIVVGGRTAFSVYYDALNKSLGNTLPTIDSDFGSCVKGLKTIKTIQNAVDTELSNLKIKTDAIAAKVYKNLLALEELTPEHGFLFADKTQLVQKEPEDFLAAVGFRITQHRVQEDARLEIERERIRGEEQAKLNKEAAAQAEFNARVAKVEAVQDAVQVANAQPVQAELVEPVQTGLVPRGRPQGPPTLKLGQIAVRLGFNVSGTFLESLGILPDLKDRVSTLFYEDRFESMCKKIAAHVIKAGESKW